MNPLVYVCMSVHTYPCKYGCVHADVSNLYSDITVNIFDVSLDKYGCHIAHIFHTGTC